MLAHLQGNLDMEIPQLDNMYNHGIMSSNSSIIDEVSVLDILLQFKHNI